MRNKAYIKKLIRNLHKEFTPHLLETVSNATHPTPPKFQPQRILQTYNPRMDAMTSRISINPEIRFGKPCVRNTRITVGDVLGWLASGMTFEEILFDFDQLTREDILACLMYAAEREQHTTRIPVAA